MSIWRAASLHARMALRQVRTIVTSSMLAKKHKPSPKCTPKGNDDDCVDDHPKPRAKENIEETFPFFNLIKFNDECCGNPCIDKDFPSFDQCLYKESDKNKRKYQITWVECAPLQIKPKKICCFAKHKRPPIVRRKPLSKPDTACKFQPCEPKGDLKCRRIKLPRCRPVRDPVRCHRVRWPSDCTKVRTPYPAFSECSRPKLRGKRRVECDCKNDIPVCELQKFLDKRLRRSGGLQLNPCK